MQIQSLFVPQLQANATTGSGGSSSSSGSTSTAVQDADSMFMKLLTAQLKNQSPLNPVDPMQFTTQLVQFNMLDQLTQINAVLQQAYTNSSAGGTQPASGGH